MVVGAPEVRTVPGTEVGFVTFGLMDPFPVEVSPEVDVKRAQAAALVRAAGIQQTQTHMNNPPIKMLLEVQKAKSWFMGV